MMNQQYFSFPISIHFFLSLSLFVIFTYFTCATHVSWHISINTVIITEHTAKWHIRTNLHIIFVSGSEYLVITDFQMDFFLLFGFEHSYIFKLHLNRERNLRMSSDWYIWKRFEAFEWYFNWIHEFRLANGVFAIFCLI